MARLLGTTLLIATLIAGLIGVPQPGKATNRLENDRDLVVLVYHRFDDSDWLSTPMDQFRRQMDHLLENDYTLLTMEQVHHHLKSGRDFPPKSVLIMVDDGYLSFHREALEYLTKKSIPVVVSPYTRATNKDFQNYMDWDILADLALNPLIHLGNHTYSHNSLAHQANGDTDWLQDEIVRAQEDVVSSTGAVPLALVLPYGKYRYGMNKNLASQGIHSFATRPGVIVAGETEPPYPRFAMSRSVDMQQFREILQYKSLPLASTSIPDGYAVDNIPDTFYVQLNNSDNIISSTVNFTLNGTPKTPHQAEEGLFGFELNSDELTYWNEITVSTMDSRTSRYQIASTTFIYEPARNRDHRPKPETMVPKKPEGSQADTIPSSKSNMDTSPTPPTESDS